VRDIHERKLAESKILESESRYRALVDQSPLGILFVDGELNLISANDAYARQVGAPSLDALQGHNIMASPALNLEGIQAIAERVRAGETISTSVSYESLFGKHVDVRVHIAPIFGEDGEFSAAQLLFEDVSESRRLEDQLRQAQKMEAVGRLAGGIAHDFNNNLTVILGMAEMLAAGEHLDPADRETAQEIVRAAERSAALTRQLLTFSRNDRVALEPVDLGDVVSQLAPMLRRVLGEAIELSWSCASELKPIQADPLLLEQVVVNLAVNARDAMPDGGALRITVSATDENQVALEVKDDGVGMDEDTRTHSIEPFFTTKETGEGTGLGLSMVYGVVRQFQGTLDLESTVGAGSRIRMCFPAVEAEPQSAAPTLPYESRSYGERILVLEDQPQVRTFVARILQREGYEVLQAETGPDALALVRSADPPIELLVSDVRIPNMSGPETVSALRQEHPGLRVLYISGHNDLAQDADGLMADGFEVLAKPFSVETLRKSVRRTLDAPRA
jgi:PAS domain S-box-containing protein